MATDTETDTEAGKSEKVNFRLPPEQLDRLRAEAKERVVSMNYLVVRALDDLFEKFDDQPLP